MEPEVYIAIIIAAQLLLLLYWVGGIFYSMQKGFNQVIKGLESIDAQLTRLSEKK